MLPAGQLTITARLTGEAAPRPTLLQVRDAPGGAGASVALPVTRQASTITVPLSGAAPACWSLDVDAPVSGDASPAERVPYAQQVAVRMTLAAR